MKDRLREAAADDSTKMLIMPVNFNDTHWALVVVLMDRREVQYYDSMAGLGVLNSLKDVASDASTELFSVLGSPGFAHVSLNSPMQFDSYNCGVFVCHKVLRTRDKTVSNDLSPDGLTKLRYRLLAYILRGIKP
jgi:Ulp1 family protease